MKRIFTRRANLIKIGFGGIALIGMIALLVATFGRTQAAAPKTYHAKEQASLKHAQPLHGHNALLNITADQGDIQDPMTGAPPPALCATYTANPYHNPAPNVDMINGDTTVTVGTQTGCKAAQNETTIAVNPSNPRNLVGGTNDYRLLNTRENRNDGSGWAYTSFDGGKTWKNVVLPHLTFQTGATGLLSDMDSAGDPAISFGPNNTVFYANLVFSRLNSASGVVVSISHDGGLTWGEPSIVHTDGVDSAGNGVPTPIFNDKEWVAADPENSKVAYVTWTKFGATDSPIQISATHDGGLTWSPAVQVNPAFVPGGITTFSSGSIPLVAKHGVIYVAYESAVCATLDCTTAGDHDETIVARSTDGGHTFTNAQVDINYDFPTNPHTGRGTLTGENFRINSFPQAAYDPETNKLWVTWADDRNGSYDANGNSIKTNGDVLVASSSDGLTWKHEYQVGTSADEVYPAVAAEEGRVAVSFYTRKYDASGINLDFAYAASSGDEPFKHTRIHRITTQSQNPQVQFVAADLLNPSAYLQGVFIGDYTAVALGKDGVLHPNWTDFRGNPALNNPNQDAYTQAIQLGEDDE